MQEQLNQRLRELGDMDSARRQSMWQRSVGSIPSSNGSMSYSSSPEQFRRGPTHQPTPPLLRQTSSFGVSEPRPHISPPLFHDSGNLYQPQGQYPPQTDQTHAHSSYQQQQAFSSSGAAYQNSAFSTAPNQQFASWGGYWTRRMQCRPSHRIRGRYTRLEAQCMTLADSCTTRRVPSNNTPKRASTVYGRTYGRIRPDPRQQWSSTFLHFRNYETPVH